MDRNQWRGDLAVLSQGQNGRGTVNSLLNLSLLILACYAMVLIARPALNARRGRWLAVALLAVLLTSGILLIPQDRIGLRALACVVFIDLFLRLADAARRADAATSLARTTTDFAKFLIPFPLFLVAGEEWIAAVRSPNPPVVDWPRTIGGIVVHVACWPLLLLLQSNPLLASHFLVDHLCKVGLFVIAIESAAQGVLGIERLLGFRTELMMNRIGQSRTPADFWARYNRRVHVWLLRNVFRPSGGAHRPLRGVVLVFAFSAAFHELAFDLATSRVDGYQATFFLLQIPAVLLSPGLERFAKRNGLMGIVTAHAATILWMAASSVFFFRGVQMVFPFLYASTPWLP
jgi:hypothetical protein